MTDTTRTLATGLRVSGADRVRWLCPWSPGEPPPDAGEGVELELVPSAVPPFRKVIARLTDLQTESRLVAALRNRPPHVVHIRGFGGTCSYLLAWTADRLGVPTVVEASPREELLCHRGTLVDWTGEACTVWDDPRRCRRCATTRDAHALGAIAAIAATALRPLRGLSPFPSIVDFENRLDMLAHGLSPATRVFLPGQADADALVRLGVPSRAFRIGPPNADDVAEWLSIYREIIRETM